MPALHFQVLNVTVYAKHFFQVSTLNSMRVPKFTDSSTFPMDILIPQVLISFFFLKKENISSMQL